MVVSEYLKDNAFLTSELSSAEEIFFTRLVETVAPIRDIEFAMDALKRPALKAEVCAQIYNDSKLQRTLAVQIKN